MGVAISEAEVTIVDLRDVDLERSDDFSEDDNITLDFTADDHEAVSIITAPPEHPFPSPLKRTST